LAQKPWIVSIYIKSVKTLQTKGFLEGWTATVSGTVSKAAGAKTTRRCCSRLAETLPPLAFKNTVERDWNFDSENHL